MFRNGFDGAFAGIIGCVAGRIRDALFAASNDDGFLLAAVGVEVREEGVDAIDYAVQVYLQRRP